MNKNDMMDNDGVAASLMSILWKTYFTQMRMKVLGI